jgi:isopentenyldiphosphate isomerase
MSDKVYPNITAVTDEDELIGYFPLFTAIAQGLRRRISAVFVLNTAGHILIQRRAALVLSPNLLDFSAAGHVNEGDDYLSSATSELSEELDITGVTLELVVPAFKALDMYIAVYKTVAPDDTVIRINPEEVAGVHWVSLEELHELIRLHPSQFAEPFLATWPHVCDKIKL